MRIFDSNCPDTFLEQEREEFGQWLKHKTDKHPYWVLIAYEQAVGCGGIYTNYHKKSKYDSEVGLAWGMILKSEQRKGYGKKLFIYRLNYLKKKYPNKTIVLRTSQHTNAFFEKFGFSTVDFTKDGWDQGLDFYEMIYKPISSENK